MSLSTSILPINFILQIVLLPVYFLLFAGTVEGIDLMNAVENVIFVLFVPLILANLTRYLFKNRKKFLENKLIPFFASSQIVFLCLAVVAMFASQGYYLLNNMGVILLILIPLLQFFIINFIVAQTVGKLFKFSYQNLVSLNMTITARNSPVALAIVVTSFPTEPLIALVLIIGPLIELPVLALLAQSLLRIKNIQK